MSDSAPAVTLITGDTRGVLPMGTRLRTYELVAVLGQGSFGTTYRARDLNLGRMVAIKEYLPVMLAVREGGSLVTPRSTEHVRQFAWGRDRFLDEARILASLSSTPSIVHVYDFLEANGTAYMVMALVEGDTLEQRLARNAVLAPAAVLRLMRPLLAGLARVHDAGFLHRDIKPANIIVDGDGFPTLIDFGASRSAVASQTRAMTAVFTPEFAGPEQFTSAKQGPWTDIYGLSATLYTAIIGHAPPPAIDRLVQDTYEPLQSHPLAGYPVAFLRGIDAGLALRPADRPQSIAEWRAMLDAPELSHVPATSYLPRERPTAPSPGPRSAGKSKSGRTVLPWLALGGACAVVVGVILYAMLSERPLSIRSIETMSAQELAQALEERRRVDAVAAEKLQREEEAGLKVRADAEAKRRADAELETARMQRQQAEQELARLKAQIEEQRVTEAGQRAKAEAEADRRRRAEADAQKKAGEEAEAKRFADEALARAQAERQRAEVEAKALQERDAGQKAAAEVAALQKNAEASEAALRLSLLARQHVQVALTALGFDTGGTDGVLGRRSRDMIAAWQKSRGHPPTAFLVEGQPQALMREAAPAIWRFDREQKKEGEEEEAASKAKAEDETRKAEEARKKQLAIEQAAAAAAPSRNDKFEEKSISGVTIAGVSCQTVVRYKIRVYSDRIELLAGNAWRSMRTDASANFSSEFLNPTNNVRYAVSGSLTRRTLQVHNLGSYGCKWRLDF